MFQELIRTGDEWIARYQSVEANSSGNQRAMLGSVGLTPHEVDTWYNLIADRIINVFGRESSEFEQWKMLVQRQSDKYAKYTPNQLFYRDKEEKVEITTFLKGLQLKYTIIHKNKEPQTSIFKPSASNSQHDQSFSLMERLGVFAGFIASIATLIAFVADRPIAGVLLILIAVIIGVWLLLQRRSR